MPTLRCLRRTGDQPSHLSDRALSSIAPHSKTCHRAVDGGAAAVITDQCHFCGLDLSQRSGPFRFSVRVPPRAICAGVSRRAGRRYQRPSQRSPLPNQCGEVARPGLRALPDQPHPRKAPHTASAHSASYRMCACANRSQIDVPLVGAVESILVFARGRVPRRLASGHSVAR
jgi:hypothetical protein